MDQQNLEKIYCSGTAACKNTCPDDKIFEELEMDTVVFENGKYFKFEDYERSSFLQELPKIKDKELLKNIFCDIENTIGFAGVIKNDDGTLIWEF